MNVEQFLELEFVVQTELLGEYVPRCHFVHHKSHIPLSWMEHRS
jgi:hypothetical protein